MIFIRKFDSNNVEDILPLSVMQNGMLVYYLRNKNSNVYFEILRFDITGSIDEKHFVNTWKMIIAHNQMLRTEIVWEKLDTAIQIVLKYHEGNIELYDYSSINCPNFEAIDLKASLESVPFKIVLYKYDVDKYKLVISSHHILLDGWSTSIILQEFLSTYYQLMNDKEAVFTKKCRYKDYLKLLKNQDKDLEQRYWKSQFENFDFNTVNYFQRIDNKGAVINIANEQINLRNDTKIQDFLVSSSITLADYVYTGWAVTLSKYTGLDDISFGTTVSGRTLPLKNIENTVGLFINTIPFRKVLKNNTNIINELYNTNRTLAERTPYETSTQFDIKRYCACYNELFDSIVVIENYPLNINEMLEKNMFKIVHEDDLVKGEYDIILNVSLKKKIEITISYNKSRISCDSIKEISGYLKNILEQMAENKYKKINDLDVYDNMLHDLDKNQLDIDEFDFNI